MVTLLTTPNPDGSFHQSLMCLLHLQLTISSMPPMRPCGRGVSSGALDNAGADLPFCQWARFLWLLIGPSISTGLCQTKVPCGSSVRICSIALTPCACVSHVFVRYMTSDPHCWNCQQSAVSLPLLICVWLFASDRLPQLRLVSQRSLRRSVASAVGIVMV